MKKILIIIVLCLLAPAASAEKLPVVCQEFPPYNYLGEESNVIGSSTEIVIEVLHRMGYEADIRLMPWNRAYKVAANGEIAMLYTFSKSVEREDSFLFTDSFASVEVVFFKRKTENINWNVLSDLKDIRIGYVRGYNYGSTMMEALRTNTFNKTDVIPASISVDYQQLRKLVNNRIDLAVCPKYQCFRIILMKAPELNGLDCIDKPIGPAREFYGGFSKKWPDARTLRDRFNIEYRKFVNEGGRSKIFNKYGLAE